ncbi:MAG: N-ethylammeline chlorohydrolase [Gammaproteobacteria bacterium]|nr:N-ethylammeline chlorohydrolase [Gammaproteobacteria bacterium]
MNIDSLICARWIIPVEPDDTLYENYAIAIANRKIVDLLPIAEATTRYQAAEVHRLDRHALIPGLINAHTHAAMTLFRGIADDLPLMEWLQQHIWPAEQKWISPEFVTDGTRLAIAEMLRGGTTCFNDMYFFPEYTAETAMNAGMRAVIGLIMLDFPTPWARDPQEYFEKGEHVHDRFKHSPLIRTAFAPHSPYTVADASLKKIGTLAEELDLQIHIHLHETATEIQQSLEQYGKRPLARLQELGLLSNRLVAVHMTQLDPADIELVTKYGAHIVHCPESNLKLASGFCPVAELSAAGINLATGTDGAASNNDLDMIGEMRTTALLAKGVAHNSSAVPARQALRMATINGARALGIDTLTGSLQPGKEADITAIDLEQLETQPLYDPVSQIIYASSRNQVTDVWVAGKQLLKNRELTTISEEQIRNGAAIWQQKLKE